MSNWILEPGHSAARFRARHMMVTWVDGHIKDVHGKLEFDPANGSDLSLSMEFDVNNLWTGEPNRDEHLLSSDFLDANNHPKIIFTSKNSERVGASDYKVIGMLDIRGITKEVVIDFHYLGKWKTNYWKDSENVINVTRVGFSGSAKLNRHDFDVDWNDNMENGGVVVGHEIEVFLDLEGLDEEDMQ